MRLLLDTHAAVWAVASPERLSGSVAEAIADTSNEIFVSVASLWEIAIKFSLGRKQAPPFDAEAALTFFHETGFALLDITPAHVVAVGKLAIEHSDPFDRLLIAQALTEPMMLVSKDQKIAACLPQLTLW